MDTSGIDKLLAELRAASVLASGGIPAKAQGAAAVSGADFGAFLKDSIDRVNHAQLAAGRLAREFEFGASNVNLTEVMISLQKANISFQEAVQVRNKLVAAYHDIMNMQL